MRNDLYRNKNGFTLAELLIVVAIIGVLVAISIPIFSSQMERSREAVDLANVRAAYAEVMSDALTENKDAGSTYDDGTERYTKTVQLKQKVLGWTTPNPTVAGITPDDTIHWQGQVLPEGDCTVFYDTGTQSVTLLWSGLTVKNNYQWNAGNGKIVLSKSSLIKGWVASSIPNAIDKKINANQSFTVSGLSKALKDATEGGRYQFEIGYFITKDDGTVIVDSGYIVLDDDSKDLNITTDTNSLAQQGSHDYSVKDNVTVTDGEDCKVCIQLFKVKTDEGYRSGSVQLTDAEAAELTNLISLNTGTGNTDGN